MSTVAHIDEAETAAVGHTEHKWLNDEGEEVNYNCSELIPFEEEDDAWMPFTHSWMTTDERSMGPLIKTPLQYVK